MAEDLLESNHIYSHIYLQIICGSNSAAIGYFRFQLSAILTCSYPCTYNSYNFETFWQHIFHKLQGGSLSTLSNPINKLNIIQANLYLKIRRYWKIGSFDCLVIAEDLLESEYIYPHIYCQITSNFTFAVNGHSKFK